jgi:hypothetical protein
MFNAYLYFLQPLEINLRLIDTALLFPKAVAKFSNALVCFNALAI